MLVNDMSEKIGSSWAYTVLGFNLGLVQGLGFLRTVECIAQTYSGQKGFQAGMKLELCR